MVNSIVIKLGGSTLFTDGGKLNPERINDLVSLVEDLQNTIKLSIIVGGGSPTRRLVNSIDSFGLTHSQLDHLSILQTQVHGSIITEILKSNGISSRFVTSYQQLLSAGYELTICSGLFPGQSTNAVAALTAEIQQADLLINLFGFDKIHSVDPKTGKDGIALDELNYEELRQLISEFKQQPGHYELFDQQALNYVERSNIPVLFLNGASIHKIRDYLNGKSIGSLVRRN